MLDTSSDYGTQPDVGRGVKESGIPREDVYVVTKIEENDDPLEAAMAYVDDLGLDHADLILIHRPPPGGAGEELWKGLLEARREGVARDVGVSNYSIDEIQALVDATGEVPTVNQIEWSPFGHSPEMLDFCRSNEIVAQAYSPLTGPSASTMRRSRSCPRSTANRRDRSSSAGTSKSGPGRFPRLAAGTSRRTSASSTSSSGRVRSTA
jgi:diketogulonate reductase-like aldo/keto reductase